MNKLIYKSYKYNIFEIELDEEDCHQYHIFINETMKPKVPSAKIDRDCYSLVENGIEYAHQMAKETIAQYFKD